MMQNKLIFSDNISYIQYIVQKMSHSVKTVKEHVGISKAG